MESHVPALIQEYFVGDKGTKAGLTQLEEVQAQLWDLEQRLLRHMAEEQDKTASKVAADLRLTLLEEGVTTGVTEEVSLAPLPVSCLGSWFALRGACQEEGGSPG